MLSALLFASTLVGLVGTAFCSGLETALMSVGRGRVTHLAREGSKAAGVILAALREMNTTLTSLLVGNNLSSVVFSASAAALGERLCADASRPARIAWTLGSAFVVLYLSEFLPKLLCSARPLSWSLALAPAYRVFSRVFSPLTGIAMAATSVFIPKSEVKEKVTANEILRILADRKDGVKLTDFESALISRILLLRRRNEFITVDSLLPALDDEDI